MKCWTLNLPWEPPVPQAAIIKPDQGWCSDITYVPMRHEFLYLVAVMDRHSRCVLSWRLSNSLDVEFCLEALEEALNQGTTEILNTDQGAQFTSRELTSRLEREVIAISMDGKERALDNVMIERLRSREIRGDLPQGIRHWNRLFYGPKRLLQVLLPGTPASVLESPSGFRTNTTMSTVSGFGPTVMNSGSLTMRG